MTQEWITKFFEMLAKRMESFTSDNLLMKNEITGSFILKTMFAATLQKTDFVMVQAMAFLAKEDVLLLEVYIKLKDEVEKEMLPELEKAIQEINTYSPAGTFGVYPTDHHVYLRQCFRLDTEKKIEDVVEDTIVNYEMMMECVVGTYPGLKAIWSGEMCFEDTLREELLIKHSN